MTAALLERPDSAVNGCRFPRWCLGSLCTGPGDPMHVGRPSEVHSYHRDFDILTRSTWFDFGEDATSGPLVEIAANRADNGYGVYVNLSPAEARELSAVLMAAGTRAAPRGEIATIRAAGNEHCSGGTITVELLDESCDLFVGLSVRDVRMARIEITFDGDGESSFEECDILDVDAQALSRYLLLASYEVESGAGR